MCFASTRCATVEPGNTWDLAPFCGRSTCVVSEDTPPRLLELVEDCGPLPLANEKCKLDTGNTPNFCTLFPMGYLKECLVSGTEQKNLSLSFMDVVKGG
jgi:hypothetical protein